MKKILFVWAVTLFVISCDSEKNNSVLKGSSNLSNSIDSMSYALGSYYANEFQNQGVKIPATELAKGLKEALEEESYMDELTTQSVMNRYQAELGMKLGRPFSEEEQPSISPDTLAYAVGASLGTFLNSIEFEMNPNTLLQGFEDLSEEGTRVLDDKQVNAKMKNLQMILEKKGMERDEKLAAVNIEKGKAFIAEKAKEDGVKSTPSGLHYKVLREGNGPSPKETDEVVVHYHGTLIDGTVFDSSVDRGTPAEFRLNGVIKGWTEGLQLMKANAKFQFYIPADLAYGNMGSPPQIDPGATLIFDVELLEVK